MTEQTTTVEQTEDAGAATALPADDQQDTAALAANEQSQTQGDASASLPEVDDKLQSFAKGLGIEDVSALSEREMKLLKVAKDNQAEYQRNAQKASELEKTLTTGTQQAIADAQETGDVDSVQLVMAEVAALKLQNTVNNFFSSNPEAKQHEQAMVKLVTDRPEIGQLVRQGALSVADLHTMVRGSDTTVVDEAKTQGATEALQQLANKQLATAVPGAATTSAVSPQKGDPLMELWAK